jgi:hypothetical protein
MYSLGKEINARARATSAGRLLEKNTMLTRF